MKKTSILLCLLGTLSNAAFTQSGAPEKRSAVSLNIGSSMAGNTIRTLVALNNNSSGNETVISRVRPALQLNYDFRVIRVVSLGIACSYQRIGMEVKNHKYVDNNNQERVENYSIGFQRTNIAFRPLFHYGRNSGIDMYSGLRLGYNIVKFKQTSSDPKNINLGSRGRLLNRFTTQLTLFGLKGYFFNDLGANFELAVGAPHFASTGLNYRF